MLRKFLIAALALALGGAAYAASITTGSNVFNLANVVANCGTPGSTYASTDNQALTQDTTGNLCSSTKKSTAGAWQSAAGVAGIVNTTTAVTMKAAAGAGLKNTVTACQVASDTLGAATELAIRDGAAGTVIWRGKLQTGPLNVTNIVFDTPLVGTANTLVEVVTLTAVTGGVYVNCQGSTSS